MYIIKATILAKAFVEILEQLLFITSETDLDYYHHKNNLRVVSRIAKQPKPQGVRKLENLKKIPEILKFYGEFPAD